MGKVEVTKARTRHQGAIMAVLTGVAIALLAWWSNDFYQTHFLARTQIGPLDISRDTLEQALVSAEQIWRFPADATLTLTTPTITIASASGQLGFAYQTRPTLERLLDAQRSLTPWQRWSYLLGGQRYQLDSIELGHDYEQLENFLQLAATAINTDGRHPSITLENGTITIDPGQQQIALDRAQTFARIQQQFPHTATISAVLSVSDEFTPLTPEEVTLLEARATALLGKSITLTASTLKNYTASLETAQLLPLLLPDSPDRRAHAHALFATINEAVSRPPQEPQLVINDTRTKATSFTLPSDGLTLDETRWQAALDATIEQLITSADTTLTLELPLVVTPPTHTLADVNDLGIREVIGFGESYYTHSSAGRIHNVAVAAAAINGTLVAPGEEFSFNRAVGDVSAASGYQPGYIIQGGRSVLSAGGGVCQVSTTVFRALLDAGLQITLRRPHSYRVTYYELHNDPGFDATVYTGNVDLRFINDTDHYVMITTTTDAANLYMYVQIWGTSDGRTTQISDYRQFNATAAPAPQYIPDPSLAPGQVQQIDWAVGGLETVFTHTIYNADGSVRSQKQYPSKYQAWSAKYLVGASE